MARMFVDTRREFAAAIGANQQAFGLELDVETVERLTDYYELVQEHNPLLHLVAPCSAEEFAVRHILESLTMLEFLPMGSGFVDVGTGAGLPAIPCLIARNDLTATLIESKEKKSNFLRRAIDVLQLDSRTHILNSQFSETKVPDVSYVVCRALDKFVDKLPNLLRWARTKTLILFGGPSLISALENAGRKYELRLIPMSQQRYILRVRSI